ncbi:MAG: hypothetical protein U0163_03965 [Gemmatimonadaceae bacterium]
MLDLIYVLGTLALFGGLTAYLRACERIGRKAAPEKAGASSQERRP